MTTAIESFINVEVDAGNSRVTIKTLQGQLRTINVEQKNLKGSSDRSTKSLERMGRVGSRSSGQLLGRITALTGGALSFTLALRGMITEFTEFENGLVGVAKTTGLQGEALNELAMGLTEISKELPVTTNELLELAQAAGQMGVTGKENLEIFALTVAKLGRASNLAGEEAAKMLARILNVTGESIGSVETLASVIVSLGNQVASTESEIARMTNEIARATTTYKLSSAEIAAMAAAMSALGIRAESGGSAIGRTFEKINQAVQSGGQELLEFANIMDLNAEALASTFRDDKIAAFNMFLDAVAKKGEAAGLALEELGLGGLRITSSIKPLANNMELYAKTQEIANKEVENATALNTEFEATLDSVNSKWIVFKNRVGASSRVIANDFLPAGGDLLLTLGDMVEEIENAPTHIKIMNQSFRGFFSETDQAIRIIDKSFEGMFDNINTEALTMAQVLTLSIGTLVADVESLVAIGTVETANLFRLATLKFRQFQGEITFEEYEQLAKGATDARLSSLDEILGKRKEELELLFDMINAAKEGRAVFDELYSAIKPDKTPLDISTDIDDLMSPEDFAAWERSMFGVKDAIQETGFELESLESMSARGASGLEMMAQMANMGIMSMEDYADAVARVAEEAKNSKEPLDEMSEFAKQASRNMQDAMADFLFDPFDDGLKGMVKGFGNALKRMIAEAAAAKIFDMGKNFLAKKAGGGGILGALGSFAGLFDGGGSIPAGSFGRVAEKRSEIVDGVLVAGPAKVTGGAQTEKIMSQGKSVVVKQVNMNFPGITSAREAKVATSTAMNQLSETLGRASRYE